MREDTFRLVSVFVNFHITNEKNYACEGTAPAFELLDIRSGSIIAKC